MEIQTVPVALGILTGWGDLLARSGQPERSLELLTFVLHHPATEKQTQNWVTALLSDPKLQLSHPAATAVEQRGKAQTLEGAAAALLA
jgi:hypothetical protein